MIVLNREGMVAAEKAAIKSYITEESLKNVHNSCLYINNYY